MDKATLLAVADVAHELNRSLNREAFETYNDVKREATYAVAGAFGDFADALRHVAENSGP